MRRLNLFLLLICWGCCAKPEDLSAYEALNDYIKSLDIIQEHAFQPLTKKALLKLSLEALIEKIDPHGKLLSETSQQTLKDQLRGSFQGIGIVFSETTAGYRIDRVFPNTPAAQADIQTGDYIHTLNAVNPKSLAFEEIARQLRTGSSPLTIEIKRQNKILTKTLRRRKISLDALTWGLTNTQIAWVKIPSFISSETPEKMNEILKKIGDFKQLKGIIFDFRGNSGGLLKVGIEFCNLFLDQKRITTIKGKDPTDQKEYLAGSGEVFANVPLVILVDKNTASAAEIVVGCLKDHDRALIVGTKTYGKASIQSIFPISPDLLLQLTTHQYFTPNGININQHGIVPDLIISHNTNEVMMEKIDQSDTVFTTAETLIQELAANGQTIRDYKKTLQRVPKP